MKVFLSLLAQVQIAEEALLRDQQLFGDGVRFFDAVDTLMELLESQPRIGSLHRANDRKLETRAIRVGGGTHSLLVYEISGEEVFIRALVDVRRVR